METPLRLEVMSPEAVLVSCGVRMVTLPGRKGAFQVLRNHAALVTSLSAGNITYRAEDGSESSIPVSGGFAQVRDNVVNVCIEG